MILYRKTVPGPSLNSRLEIPLHNIGLAWRDCTSCLRRTARFESICSSTTGLGVMQFIQGSVLEALRINTGWRSADTPAMQGMRWPTTTGNSSQRTTPITTPGHMETALHVLSHRITMLQVSGTTVVTLPASPVSPRNFFLWKISLFDIYGLSACLVSISC